MARKIEHVHVPVDSLLGVAKKMGMRITERAGGLSIQSPRPGVLSVWVQKTRSVDHVDVSGFIPPAGIDQRNIRRLHEAVARVRFAYSAKDGMPLAIRDFQNILSCLKPA